MAESHTENEKLQQQQTSGTIEQNKIHQVERLNLQNEITSLKSQLQQTETRLTQEIQTAQTTINNLESSLTEQKNKNDVSCVFCVCVFLFFFVVTLHYLGIA